MNKPISNFYTIQLQLEKMQELLTAKNDNKAEILALLNETTKNISIYQKEFWAYERSQEHDQTGYFENIKIKYSIKCFGADDPHSTFEREFNDYLLDMKTIRSMVRTERELHNKNECYLSAEIILSDLDCEDEE